MELSPTARVLLAMIRSGRRTGYEIKQLVDVSTRFFWAASYGQIYPELRRLSEGGLIAGKPDAGTGRGRIEFELTPEGRRRLEEWLGEPPAIQEMRDQPVDDAVEPRLLEGRILGAGELQLDVPRDAAPRNREHLRRRVHSPHRRLRRQCG